MGVWWLLQITVGHVTFGACLRVLRSVCSANNNGAYSYKCRICDFWIFEILLCRQLPALNLCTNCKPMMATFWSACFHQNFAILTGMNYTVLPSAFPDDLSVAQLTGLFSLAASSDTTARLWTMSTGEATGCTRVITRPPCAALSMMGQNQRPHNHVVTAFLYILWIAELFFTLNLWPGSV